MLVSHRYRFIYTKTSKTAGTSVESYFERYCMPEGEWQESHARDEYVSPTGIIGHRGAGIPPGTLWRNHMPAALIRELVGPQVWNSYFKFCVVRNPFEKAISGFCHLGRHHPPAAPRTADPEPGGGEPHAAAAEQRRFISYLEQKAPFDRDKYMIDGEFCLDDVIRYETLDADMTRICRRLGVEYDPARLPRFKTGLRDPGATAEALYTDRSRRLVEDIFGVELRYFGYSFPGAG